MSEQKNAEKVFDKIMKLSLSDLLKLCAVMLDDKVDIKRTDTVLRILELKLQKRRFINQLGLNGEK